MPSLLSRNPIDYIDLHYFPKLSLFSKIQEGGGIKTNESILRIFSSRKKILAIFYGLERKVGGIKNTLPASVRGRFLLQKTAVVKISLKSSQLFIYKSVHREALCLLRFFKKCIVFG